MTASIISHIRKYILLYAIFGSALLVRIVNLGDLPLNLYEDELLSGYIGRYILQNGTDIYGNSWPLLYFNKFNDYYIIMPMYLAGLSTFLFGSTAFAIRLPVALAGALLVFPVYFLAKQLSANKTAALWSAGLAAVIPWHVVLGRATTESILESTLLATSLLYLIKAVRSKSGRLLVMAMALSAVSYLIYHTSRLLVPLFWLGAVLIWWTELPAKKFRLWLVVALVIFVGLTGYISQTEWGRGRFDQTSIFSLENESAILLQELTYNLGGNNIFAARIFHNKLVVAGHALFTEYTKYFSPGFLWLNGWQNTRYHVPAMGPVSLTVLLGIIGALWPVAQSAVKKLKLKVDDRVALFWSWVLVITPLPAAMTIIESPNVRRTAFMVVPLVIFAGFGLEKWRAVVPKFSRLVPYLAALLLALETVAVGYFYVFHFDAVTAFYRSDGHRQLADYLVTHRADYDQLFVTGKGSISLYYLFEAGDYSPDLVGAFDVDTILPNYKNLHFVDVDCPSSYLHRLFEFTADTDFSRIGVVDKYFCESPAGFKDIAHIAGVDQSFGHVIRVPHFSYFDEYLKLKTEEAEGIRE